MKKLTLLIAVMLIAKFANAQITFQKTFGGTGSDWGQNVQQTFDGGYIITGWAGSFGAGSQDVYLIKTDAQGDTLWTKTYGGADVDRGMYVLQTNDSGYIVAGWSQSFGAGDWDVYIIKTDINGDTLWTKTYGDYASDGANSILQTSDGGYIIGGGRWVFGAGNEIYLIKIDAVGDTLWTQTFGATAYDFAESIQLTIDGEIIITGHIKNFGAGLDDIYLIKTDTSGIILWAKSFGGFGWDFGQSVQQTTDGGFIVAGSLWGGVVLLKTDANGDTLWTKIYGGATYREGYSVQQTTDGGYIVAGYAYDFIGGDKDVYLIKTDSNGDTLWTNSYGGINDDFGDPQINGLTVRQTSDGGYVVVSSTNSFGAGQWDVYLIKTDSLGKTGCNEKDIGTTVTVDPPQEGIPLPEAWYRITTVSSTSTLTLSSSGAGTTTTLCTSVGIKELTNDNLISIYPNPSIGNFTISFERMIVKGNLEILNFLGEIIFSENIYNESRKEINLKNISQGIYLVKVFDGETSYCKKLIVE